MVCDDRQLFSQLNTENYAYGCTTYGTAIAHSCHKVRTSGTEA